MTLRFLAPLVLRPNFHGRQSGSHRSITGASCVLVPGAGFSSFSPAMPLDWVNQQKSSIEQNATCLICLGEYFARTNGPDRCTPLAKPEG